MNIQVKTLLLCALLPLFACQGPEESGVSPDCCIKAKQILEGLPECCQDNLGKPPAEWTGCCADGMVAGVADDQRPECCKTTLAARASFPQCCQEVLFEGKKNDCCADM